MCHIYYLLSPPYTRMSIFFTHTSWSTQKTAWHMLSNYLLKGWNESMLYSRFSSSFLLCQRENLRLVIIFHSSLPLGKLIFPFNSFLSLRCNLPTIKFTHFMCRIHWLSETWRSCILISLLNMRNADFRLRASSWLQHLLELNNPALLSLAVFFWLLSLLASDAGLLLKVTI